MTAGTLVDTPTTEATLARAAGLIGPRPRTSALRDYVALTKPRIIVLLEVTALCSMVMAARGWPSWRAVLATLVGGALAAGGANAVNMWFDRDIDATMARTCSRPLPAGRIAPRRALAFGVGLGVGAFAVLALWANLVAALLAIAAYLFYVLVYTMYLKRTSMQNIVIGGAAGAVPPLVGFAAVDGRIGVAALFCAAIVFYWTPPHFWALALLVRNDYARARVPMLPVVVGARGTRLHVLLYSLLLVVVTVLPILAGQFHWAYAGGVAVFDGLFVAGAVRLFRRPSGRTSAWLFHYSLLYLAAVFAVGAIDRVVFH